MKGISLILLLNLFMSSSYALLPDIGDNSIFECIEYEDPNDTSMCYGDINWIADKKGDSKTEKTIYPKKANKVLNSYIKYFKKQKRKANRQCDTDSADSWDSKITIARQSKEDIYTCYDTYTTCEGSNDDSEEEEGSGNSSTPPALSQACDVIINPATEAARARNNPFDKKFIVNGVACSNASTSPVIKILNQGSQHCTGTLIKSDLVITAAHCVENINCANKLTVENATGSQNISVASCTAHSGYGSSNSTPQKNDVALLFLDSSFQGISPVKINTIDTTAELDDLAVLAGYGIDEDDNDILKATFNYISNVETEVISTFYTRGDTNRGTTCSGDSGGALFIFKGGEWKTQGTLSDGSAFDCALPGTSPNKDTSNWANLTSTSNQNFIKNNTDGVLD